MDAKQFSNLLFGLLFDVAMSDEYEMWEKVGIDSGLFSGASVATFEDIYQFPEQDGLVIKLKNGCGFRLVITKEN